jgi:hypothetical protein
LQDTFQLSDAVADVLGEAIDSLSIDESVRDEAHRSGGHVSARVPLGGAGRRVGATTLAGAKSRELRGGG